MSQETSEKVLGEEKAETEEEIEDDCYYDTYPLTIRRPLNTVVEKLELLDEKVDGRHGIIARLEELEAQFADMTNDYCEIKAENKEIKKEVKLLKAIVIKKDKQIEDLKDSVVDLKSRSMRSNLLMHNIPEQKDENCENVFKQCLQQKTDLDPQSIRNMTVERVHRVGPPREGRTPRPLVAKFLCFKDKETVLAAWRRKSKLNGRPQKNMQRLTNQLPPEMLQKRALNFQMVENVKAKAGKDADINYKMHLDKLIINNQTVKPLVEKVTTEDMMNVTEADRAAAQKHPRGASKTIFEQGSSFAAEVFKTSDIKHTREVYKCCVSAPDKAKATHNILAYRVGKDIGWQDDDELGAGRFLTTWMQREGLENTTIIVTRQYGGKHLGSKRYELMRQAAKEAHRCVMDK